MQKFGQFNVKSLCSKNLELGTNALKQPFCFWRRKLDRNHVSSQLPLKLKMGFLSIEAGCERRIPMGTHRSLEVGEHSMGFTEQPEAGSDPVRTQLFNFTRVLEHREMARWCCLLPLSQKFKTIVLVQQNHRYFKAVGRNPVSWLRSLPAACILYSMHHGLSHRDISEGVIGLKGL